MKQQAMFAAPEMPPGTVEVELPWPPSVNHYKSNTVMLPKAAEIEAQHRGDWKATWRFIRSKVHVSTFLTDEAKEYHVKVQAVVIRANARKYYTRPLKMTVFVYPPDRRKRDQSNLLKMIEDALAEAKVYADDSQIKEHHVYFGDVVQFGKVIVRIEELV